METEQLSELMYSDKCTKHMFELEFYCQGCKQMICKKCVTDHSKEGHQCLFLEDYGRQNLLTGFDEIVEQLKKNSEEINLSPTASKEAASGLVEALKSLRTNLQNDVAYISQEIDSLERLKASSFVLPSLDELLRIIDQCKKSLEGEVKHSSGIVRAIEIIQATKDLLSGLAANTMGLRKAREQVAKVESELQISGFLKSITQLRVELKKVSQNSLVAYSARVGIPLSSRCIYGIKEQENILVSYDLASHVLKDVEFPIELPTEPTVTQVADRVYFTGGGNYLDSNIEYTESTGQATKKAIMSVGKKWHTTVVLNDKEFIVIGGYSNIYKHLNVCEKYNSMRDIWEDVPKLNECKQSVAACLVEKKEIFAFGGYSGVRHNTVEHLNISPMDEAWTIIKLENEDILPPFSCGAASQISMSEILILRGNRTADTFIYSIKERFVRKAQPTKKGDSFLLQTLYPTGSSLAAIGYYGGAHMFDIKSQSWDEPEYVIG